jgi:transposase
LKIPNEYLQMVLDEHLDYLQTRIKHLEQQIEQVAESEIYGPAVRKPRAFKGMGTLSAMLFITEITNFRRFHNHKSLMGFLGLIVSEDFSGDK